MAIHTHSLECCKDAGMRLVDAASFVQELFPYYQDPRARQAMVRLGLAGLGAEVATATAIADPRRWSFSVDPADVPSLAREMAFCLAVLGAVPWKVREEFCREPDVFRRGGGGGGGSGGKDGISPVGSKLEGVGLPSVLALIHFANCRNNAKKFT